MNKDEIRARLAELSQDVRTLMNLRVVASKQYFAIYDWMNDKAVEETRKKAKAFDEEAAAKLRGWTEKIHELERELSAVRV